MNGTDSGKAFSPCSSITKILAARSHCPCSCCAKRCKCFSSSAYEVKSINLADQCNKYHPGRKWIDLPVHQQVGVMRLALQPDNFLIDPHSAYMKYWDFLIIICLIWVGIVTPYEVIFVGPLHWTDKLFIASRTVDLIFMKDMVLQFFLKIQVASGKRGRVLIKDPWQIRKTYLTSWFAIDLLGVMQFDLIFLMFSDATSVSGIKFLRMARLLRLIKLLRMLRGSRALQRWQNYFTVSFAAQKLVKFALGLLLCSHWMACFWGWVGFTVGDQLCDDNGNRKVADEDLTPEGVSWISTLYIGGGAKYGPDSPCNSLHIYTAALHWSVMTITSIGYGDIYPVRSEEYLACVVCMLLGGVLWANIIAGTCAVIARGDPVQDRFETNTDLLNSMMDEAGVPKRMQRQFREYLREAKVRDTVGHFRELASNFSPALKGQLLMFVSRTWTEKVPYLHKAGERSVMGLVDCLHTRFFSSKEVVNIHSDCLGINERGTIARGGRIITPGMVFNMDFVVSNPRLRKREESVALTYCLIMILERGPFMEIVARQHDMAMDVKRAAVRYAMRRCLRLCVEEYRKMCGRDPELHMTFSQVFDHLEIGDRLKGGSRRSLFGKVIKVNLTGCREEEGAADFDMCPSLKDYSEPAPAAPEDSSERTLTRQVSTLASAVNEVSRRRHLERSKKKFGEEATAVGAEPTLIEDDERPLPDRPGGPAARAPREGGGGRGASDDRLAQIEEMLANTLVEVRRLRAESDGASSIGADEGSSRAISSGQRGRRSSGEGSSSPFDHMTI